MFVCFKRKKKKKMLVTDTHTHTQTDDIIETKREKKKTEDRTSKSKQTAVFLKIQTLTHFRTINTLQDGRYTHDGLRKPTQRAPTFCILNV